MSKYFGMKDIKTEKFRGTIIFINYYFISVCYKTSFDNGTNFLIKNLFVKISLKFLKNASSVESKMHRNIIFQKVAVQHCQRY